MAIKPADRTKVEKLIYSVMNILDPSQSNTDHYKEIFSKMSDKQFEEMFSGTYPLKFHYKPFEIEPKITQIKDALKFLGVPVVEKVKQGYLYKNEEGTPVSSKPTLVGYIHLKKEQQFITKKNSMSTDIAQRDMKTGLLIRYDKNGKCSDREAEALIVHDMYDTLEEFTGPRADSMNAKNLMYSTINSLGYVSKKDYELTPEDSLAFNLINAYMLGAMLNSNLVNIGIQLPYTLKNKTKEVSRI